jgi:hypothetical protein
MGPAAVTTTLSTTRDLVVSPLPTSQTPPCPRTDSSFSTPALSQDHIPVHLSHLVSIQLRHSLQLTREPDPPSSPSSPLRPPPPRPSVPPSSPPYWGLPLLPQTPHPRPPPTSYSATCSSSLLPSSSRRASSRGTKSTAHGYATTGNACARVSSLGSHCTKSWRMRGTTGRKRTKLTCPVRPFHPSFYDEKLMRAVVMVLATLAFELGCWIFIKSNGHRSLDAVSLYTTETNLSVTSLQSMNTFASVSRNRSEVGDKGEFQLPQVYSRILLTAYFPSRDSSSRLRLRASDLHHRPASTRPTSSPNPSFPLPHSRPHLLPHRRHPRHTRRHVLPSHEYENDSQVEGRRGKWDVRCREHFGSHGYCVLSWGLYSLRKLGGCWRGSGGDGEGVQWILSVVFWHCYWRDSIDPIDAGGFNRRDFAG